MLRQAFLFFVHGSSSEPDIYTMAVGGWPSRGLAFQRENSDGHSPKLNNVGSQPSKGKLGTADSSSKILFTLHFFWAWFLQAYLVVLSCSLNPN